MTLSVAIHHLLVYSVLKGGDSESATRRAPPEYKRDLIFKEYEFENER